MLTLIILAVTGSVILLIYRHPVRHVETINKYSQQYSLDPVLVFALINAESSFNDNAVSSAGASGLMQIMEDTATWIAPMAGLPDFKYEQIFNPDVNIRLGCFYLSMCMDKFGSLENALCAYNAGGGSVERWLADPRFSNDGVTLDLIPFAETRNYVKRIEDNMRIYRVLLAAVPGSLGK